MCSHLAVWCCVCLTLSVSPAIFIHWVICLVKFGSSVLLSLSNTGILYTFKDLRGKIGMSGLKFELSDQSMKEKFHVLKNMGNKWDFGITRYGIDSIGPSRTLYSGIILRLNSLAVWVCFHM